MKYCPVEGLRYPDSLTHCKTCGAQLLSADEADIFTTSANVSFHTLCCPKPMCRMVVAPAQTKFCALCGSELVAISLDVWAAKCVRPELESRPVEFLLHSVDALRPAAEMGLPREEVEARLEQLVTEQVGVSPDEFMKWVQESSTALREGRDSLEETKRQNLEQANARGISRAFAFPVVERLAAKAEAERASAPSLKDPLPDAANDKKDEGTGQRGKESGTIVAAKSGKAKPAGEAARPAGGAPSKDKVSTVDPGRQKAAGRASSGASGTSASAPAIDSAVPELAAGRAVGGLKKSDEEKSDAWGAPARKAAVLFAVVFILFASVLVINHFVRRRGIRPVDVDVSLNANQAGSPGPSADTARAGVPDADSSPIDVALSPRSSAEVAQPENVNSGDAQAQVATYSLLPNVDGVELWVDNVRQGSASRARPRNVILSPGPHQLRATKPNYEVWERGFNVTEGQRLTVPVLMEEMRGGVISSGTPLGGSSPPSSSPRDAARAYAEDGERLFNVGQVDEALAVVNEGLRAVGDEPSLNNLKRRLERAKQLLDKRSTVAADPLGPTQKRSPEPEARADRGAQLVRMPSPVYPADATSKGSTTVWVEVQVDERGAVSSARAVRGPSRFYNAAVNATRQAVFRPAVRNGRSAGDKLVLPVMFNPG